MRKITPEQKRLILLLGVFALLFVFVLSNYVIKPLAKQSSELKARLKQARETVHDLDRVVSQRVHLVQRHKALLESVDLWRGRMPAEGQLPIVIKHLSVYARDAGIRIQGIMPQPPEKEDKPVKSATAGTSEERKLAYVKIPINIEAEAGFHQLGKFINLLETAEIPLHVVSLRISADKDDPYKQRVQMRIRSFFSLENSLDDV